MNKCLVCDFVTDDAPELARHLVMAHDGIAAIHILNQENEKRAYALIEENYRNGYIDGYLQSTEKFIDLIEDDKMTAREAYLWLYEFCMRGSLKKWADDKDSKHYEPPEA